MKPAIRIGLPTAIVVILLVVWEIAVRLTHTQGLVPLPSGVVRSGIALTEDGTLMQALASSLERVIIGFAIAAAIGRLRRVRGREKRRLGDQHAKRRITESLQSGQHSIFESLSLAKPRTGPSSETTNPIAL